MAVVEREAWHRQGTGRRQRRSGRPWNPTWGRRRRMAPGAIYTEDGEMLEPEAVAIAIAEGWHSVFRERKVDENLHRNTSLASSLLAVGPTSGSARGASETSRRGCRLPYAFSASAPPARCESSTRSRVRQPGAEGVSLVALHLPPRRRLDVRRRSRVAHCFRMAPTHARARFG